MKSMGAQLLSIGAIIIAALTLAPSSIGAQPTEGVIVRAVGPHFNNHVIRYVARNAQPFSLDALEVGVLEDSTPRRVISKLCGSLKVAYWEEFLAANNLKSLPEDEPLGGRAKTLTWPACLYARVYENREVTVKPDDTAVLIYNRMTGGEGSPRALEQFFRQHPEQLKALKPNQRVRAAHATAPVRLVPRELGAEDFVARLKAEVMKPEENRVPVSDVTSVLRMVTISDGNIVVGMTASDAGTICKPQSGDPFDAVAVQRAYKHAMSLSDGQIGTAQVTVVDNGFFGADPQKVGKEFDGSPFPRHYFRPDRQSVVAMRLQLDEIVYPLNALNAVQPDSISGHGTHVAGLVLGGPAFVEFRDTLRDTNLVPWVSIAIYNVGKGSKEIKKGTQTQLQSLLTIPSVGQIVNMSIAYTGANDDTRAAFDRLFREADHHLFIVSAGNSLPGKNVVAERVVPASLGGTDFKNVLSVAALDGDNRLASFSNYGKRAVDLAAPGCAISSWITNTSKATEISGTSQAAPLVSFAAALLSSLNTGARLELLKTRLVTSGDLLDPEDQRNTLYRVRLNIPKALYWSNDYVKLKGPRAGEYLGEVRSVPALQCVDDRLDRNLIEDLWAIKRDSVGTWLYLGKRRLLADAPCNVLPNAAGQLQFSPSYSIVDGAIKPMKDLDVWTEPFANVQEVVLKSRF